MIGDTEVIESRMAALSGDGQRLRDSILAADGSISVARFSNALRLSAQELVSAAGISREAAKRPERAKSAASQRGLREMMEIIDRVTPWAGSPLQAYAWYRSEPIPAFGEMTAEQIIKQGYVDSLRKYLDGIAAGGYA